MKIVAVILAGGEGRRMGGRKPLRPFGEATLIANALGLGHGYAPEVAVAVRHPAQAGELAAPALIDDPGLDGPLAGLASALAYARSRGAARVLILPCDMPRLPVDLAIRLAGALDGAPEAGCAIASSGGRLHPVCSLWDVRALARLAAYVQTGSRSLRGFGAYCRCVTVDWGCEPEDPFANANTPEDLAALQPTSTRRAQKVGAG